MRFAGMTFALLILVSGCADSRPVPQETVTFDGVIPSPPENSDHGYLLEDERIPTIPTCSEWEKFWVYDGPAVSFSVAQANGDLFYLLEVSTEIYLKNKHLDMNGDGILCESEGSSPKAQTESQPSDNSSQNFGISGSFRAKESTLSLPLSNCKIEKGPENFIGVGFPRSKDLIPSIGTVRGMFLFVEFPDVRISSSIEKDFEIFATEFVEFYKRNSYGKLDIDIDFHPQAIQISRTSDEYGMQIWSQGDEVQYLLDAVSSADNAVDFSEVDFVVVIPPRNISEIVHGPAVPIADVSEVVSASEARFLAGILGGSDFRNSTEAGWYWLSHEFGHLLGMGHPYQGSSVPWDLMDNNFSQLAPDLYGWHRFQNEWLGDEDVLCLNTEDLSIAQPVRLEPMNNQSEEINLVLAISGPNELIAIEYRTGGEQNSLGPADSGILVYTVDSTRGFEGGISQVLPEKYSRLGVGRPGNSFEHNGVLIEIGTVTQEEAYVQISTLSGNR